MISTMVTYTEMNRSSLTEHSESVMIPCIPPIDTILYLQHVDVRVTEVSYNTSSHTMYIKGCVV